MNNKYIDIIKNNNGLINLFCIPYAGANGSIFHSWKQKISNEINLYSFHLPGRGKLFSDKFIHEMEQLVDILFHTIIKYFDRKIVLFGYSMGGLIAFALAKRLENAGFNIDSLIISATKPMHFYIDKKHLLSDDELKEDLRIYNATSKSILEHKEIMNLILPIYRNDCCLINSYKPEVIKTIKAPVYLFNSEDDIEKMVMLEWNNYFVNEAQYIKFEGDHFFIHSYEKKVLEQIHFIVNRKNV